MSAPLVLDHLALEAYLPHRGVNLMPDRVELAADRQRSQSATQVPAGDARGRELLGRDGGHGRRTWAEPFIAELMALTGVPLLHERLAPAGQVAVFSMISRVVVPELPGIHERLDGLATITRDRGAFTVFSTRASTGGRTCLEAEVMSGCAAMSEVAGAAAQPFPSGTPGDPVPAGLFAWKPSSLRFVDRIVRSDAAAGSMTCAYAYPADHPFVPGHFPHAALMMGVTQWQAVADAAWVASRAFGTGGRVLASGRILRPDGREVVDVRDLLLVEDAPGVPRIASTKRIAFREPVRPGDGVLIEVSVAAQPG